MRIPRPLILLLAAPLCAQAAPDLARQAWCGPAVCYSGYREGQDPDKQLYPSPAQVLEDLRILDREWKLIRLYGSDRHAADVLAQIRAHKLGLRVMLGMWLSGKPGKAEENERQVAEGIRLAKAYPDVVVAVSVGNEALVDWSDHKLTEADVIGFVKRVKAAVPCRVTVADDFLYWVKPGTKLAAEVDFITLHSYPMWGRQDIDEAFGTTVDKFEAVRKAHPGSTIVFGEVGWATFTDSNPQHVPGAGSEAKQDRYFREMNAWAKAKGVTTFFFEAFDEPWKGKGTEGHWGLFSVDRKAKPAVLPRYPELRPGGPTTPGQGPVGN